MTWPRFDFVNAQTIDQAADILRNSGKRSKVIGGGTDLLHGFKDNIYSDYPQLVINLRSAADADYIREDGDGIHIGALTTLSSLEQDGALPEQCAVLAEAAYSVATPQIRNNSTLGGNICQEPRCWYYRNADNLFTCLRKGGDFCNAQTGHNEIHSIFGSVRVKNTPCQDGCPAGNAIPDYFAKLREGDHEAAAAILLRTDPLAAITGRVCPHTCQEKCNRENVDQAVAIRSIERAVGDYMLEGLERLAPRAAATGKHIAVIGSGPAGLAAAYYLKTFGHEVTVFDKMSQAGGMLRYGIPAYRLPRDVLDAQIEALSRLGIDFVLNTGIGSQQALADIYKKYAAVFLATGAWQSAAIDLDGEEHTVSAMQFLQDVALGQKTKPGDNVIVIGGGNVAVDAAITSRRLGAAQASMVCLEDWDEMPAIKDDVEEAQRENIVIRPGWGPSRVVLSQGRVVGLEIVKCTSVFDDEGRFRPQYDMSVKDTLAADSVILAAGQRPDLSYIEAEFGISGRTIMTDPQTMATPVPGLYAGGDAVSGPASVIKAIASGHNAALAISDYVGFPVQPLAAPCAPSCRLSAFAPSCLETSSPAAAAVLPLSLRDIQQEDLAGFSSEQLQSETARCYNCGCVASSPSDMAPALIALAAKVKTTKRMIDAEDFFAAGVHTSTILDQDELVCEVLLPPPIAGQRSSYLKFRHRQAVDFPLVSVAAAITCHEGKVSQARLVLGAAAPVPIRAKEAEAFLIGRELTPETAAQAAELALSQAQPLKKNRYKMQITKTYVKRAILACR